MVFLHHPAVALYCWRSDKTAFFYAQMIIVHGSLNAAFVCADFISLYVALEVSGIAAFLLIAYPRSDRSIWVGLRYLFVSNTSMLFYLVGAVLVYQTHHSFSFAGLKGSPPEALALIFLGLLIKAGIFVSGLWLPLTHSESETPVSALMSGIVVKASVLPLLRCALVSEEIDIIVRIFGVGTALMGVSYAVLEKDTKRMLAFHTISQLGFILAAPAVGGFYALTHGLVKSSLFLIASALPSRNFKELQNKPVNTTIWIALVIASLSISGLPLLSGFEAKVLTMKNLASWQFILMNIAAIGTAIQQKRQTMNDTYLYLIIALLPLTAGMLITQTNPYHALVIRGVLGAVAAMVDAVLGAADVALTEALMGTMLSITLYAIAVRSSLVLRLGVIENQSI